MVTLKDVAFAAQVSCSTASAVLGNRAEKLGIKLDTRRKVLQAAEKLRYRKNEIAAQMKSSKANMIALFVPSVYLGEYSFQISVGAGLAAERFGCYLKVVIIDDSSDFRRQLDYTLGQYPAALLYLGDLAGNEALLREASRECRLPLMLLDYREDSVAGSVLSDDDFGIREAVRHLHELGHRNILHLTDPLKARYADARFRAFGLAMKEFGLPIRNDNIFCNQRVPAFRAEMDNRLLEIFQKPDAPTAICCGSDYFAIHALTLLQSAGIRVPEQVSIVGFGNLSFTGCSHPRLTTIDQPFQEIGSRAVEFALSDSYFEHACAPILLPTGLVLRESTCQIASDQK